LVTELPFSNPVQGDGHKGRVGIGSAGEANRDRLPYNHGLSVGRRGDCHGRQRCTVLGDDKVRKTLAAPVRAGIISALRECLNDVLPVVGTDRSLQETRARDALAGVEVIEQIVVEICAIIALRLRANHFKHDAIAARAIVDHALSVAEIGTC